MERKIGETFYDNGVRLTCMGVDYINCKGCYYAAELYEGSKLCTKKWGYVGDCAAKDRSDKTNVIFMETGNPVTQTLNFDF